METSECERLNSGIDKSSCRSVSTSKSVEGSLNCVDGSQSQELSRRKKKATITSKRKVWPSMVPNKVLNVSVHHWLSLLDWFHDENRSSANSTPDLSALLRVPTRSSTVRRLVLQSRQNSLPCYDWNRAFQSDNQPNQCAENLAICY